MEIDLQFSYVGMYINMFDVFIDIFVVGGDSPLSCSHY